MVSELSNLGLSIEPSHFASSHFKPFDSFNEFLAGVYDLFRDREYRVLGSLPQGSEVLDPSVCSGLINPDTKLGGNLLPRGECPDEAKTYL